MRGWILAATAVAVLTTGCGNDGSPADAVPALSQRLDDVDAAIASGRYGAARSALDDLAAETEQARSDGTLDPADAETILAAISNLDGELPRPTPSASPSPTPSATPSATPSPEPPPPPKPHPKPHHAKPPKPHKKPHPKPGHGHKH